MAEPKKKLSRSRSRQRRSHQGLKPANLVECKNCNTKINSHVVCYNCGFYKGKKVVVLKDEKKKITKQEDQLKDE